MILLFTDISDWYLSIKTAGAYKIAGQLRAMGHETKVINDLKWILEHKKKALYEYLDHTNPDWVGFSTTFMNFSNHHQVGLRTVSYDKETSIKINDLFTELLNYFCDRGITTVMGGFGGSSHDIWDSGLMDFWVRGIGEGAITKFANEFHSGKISAYTDNGIIQYDAYGLTYDFHNDQRVFSTQDAVLYEEALPIELSRGCRFKCKFCSYPLLGRKPSDDYVRGEESIYRELLHNYENFGTTDYYVMCDTFNETNDKVNVWRRAIERTGLPIRWTGYLRLELLEKFPEQINILRDTGIIGSQFGIETFNLAAAKRIGKGLPRDRILRTLEKCRESWGEDAFLYTSLIVGLPHDTPDTVTEWCEMLLRGETALSSWMLKDLRIRLYDASKDIFSSDFDKNPEKYGFRIHPDGWESEHWTSDTAFQFVKDWEQKFTQAEVNGYTSWKAMSFKSLGFDLSELAKVRIGSKDHDIQRKEAKNLAILSRMEYASEILQIS